MNNFFEFLARISVHLILVGALTMLFNRFFYIIHCDELIKSLNIKITRSDLNENKLKFIDYKRRVNLTLNSHYVKLLFIFLFNIVLFYTFYPYVHWIYYPVLSIIAFFGEKITVRKKFNKYIKNNFPFYLKDIGTGKVV